jgi:hypothetical protein
MDAVLCWPGVWVLRPVRFRDERYPDDSSNGHSASPGPFKKTVLVGLAKEQCPYPDWHNRDEEVTPADHSRSALSRSRRRPALSQSDQARAADEQAYGDESPASDTHFYSSKAGSGIIDRVPPYPFGSVG